MQEINVMSKELSELIAAGEVIERPSSIVKELLENSIDSGATNITIEIKHGGITYIRITDNGKGISKEDMPLAFLRHATSKLLSKDSLNSIMTLGFRGEALASICAISKVEVISKRKDTEYGTHYKIEGSIEKLCENSGCPDGTTIVIRDIFFNVPARFKFLKKAVTEGNAISGIINKLALSHPEVSIKYIRDNKQELLTAGDGKLFSAVYTVFGRQLANSMLEVDYTYNDIRVSGYVVKPLSGKSNRSFQNFFINNRYVKSVTCTVALEQAYKNSIMTGKFPACVLNISVSPDVTDVNVHPAKIEVRFSNEKLVFDSIYFAVKNALINNDTPSELKFDNKTNFTKQQLYNKLYTENQPVKQYTFNMNEASFSSKTEKYLDDDIEPLKENNQVKIIGQKKQEENIFTQDNNISSESDKPKADIPSEFKYINSKSLEKKQPPKAIITEEKKEEISIKVLGELFSTYIVAQVNDEMIMIDKHAAHERFIFEKIKNDKSNLDIQMLLNPVEVLLSFEEFDALLSQKEQITELGFLIKETNPPSVIVKGIPVVLGDNDISGVITELAHNCINNKTNPSIDFFDDLYHSIACKAAIKGNQKSEKVELQKLVSEIYNDNNIKYCPHGRPVMIKMTKREIEKQFKRII